MSCNSCNKNMASTMPSNYGRTPGMYRGPQMTRTSSNMNHPSSFDRYDSPCSPNEAPIDNMIVAMGYVPWQEWGEMYDHEKAFMIGTIFPCLDKPWKGGHM